VAALHFCGGSAQAFILTPITLMIGRCFSLKVSSTAQTLKTVASKGIGSSTGAFLYGWLYSRLPGHRVMLLFTCMIFAFASLPRRRRFCRQEGGSFAVTVNTNYKI
jgi:hypothetical protein